MFEVAIAGGTLISPRGQRRTHVQVQDGKIAAITDQHHEAAQVMPVAVDGHVNFQDPGGTPRERRRPGTTGRRRR